MFARWRPTSVNTHKKIKHGSQTRFFATSNCHT